MSVGEPVYDKDKCHGQLKDMGEIQKNVCTCVSGFPKGIMTSAIYASDSISPPDRLYIKCTSKLYISLYTVYGPHEVWTIRRQQEGHG